METVAYVEKNKQIFVTVGPPASGLPPEVQSHRRANNKAL